MKNVISIVKDFLYSAFFAIIPTMLSFIVWDFVPETSMGYGGEILISFLTFTVIVFIFRRQPSEKVFKKMCLVLLLSMFIVPFLFIFNGYVICKKIGGEYGSGDGVYDIDGERLGYTSIDSPSYACYITSEKLKEINPKAPFYKNVDFVIKD